MRRYKQKKFYEWTPDIAYLAGLIASDGCLFKDNRHINLTSTDYELISFVIDILTLSVKVGTKVSSYGSVGYSLNFSDVALYDFLRQAGIHPAKSKTIKKVLVPDRLYAEFLRGYFDGDGCIYGFWDTRWKNSLMYYTEYASASATFLQWIRSQNIRILSVSPGRVKPSDRVQALSYAKADSRILFESMYASASRYRLTRKYQKFIDFLNTDPYAKQRYARVL